MDAINHHPYSPFCSAALAVSSVGESVTHVNPSFDLHTDIYTGLQTSTHTHTTCKITTGQCTCYAYEVIPWLTMLKGPHGDACLLLHANRCARHIHRLSGCFLCGTRARAHTDPEVCLPEICRQYPTNYAFLFLFTYFEAGRMVCGLSF